MVSTLSLSNAIDGGRAERDGVAPAAAKTGHGCILYGLNLYAISTGERTT
jgi:hypothetical protein